MRKKKKQQKKNTSLNAVDAKKPFIEHLYELRRRLFQLSASIVSVTVIAYFFQQHIVNILLRPTHGQQFIYTSPGGGLDFLFRVCLYTAIVVNVPFIVYQILKYIQPLLKKDSARFIFFGSIVSGILAIAGVIFGYFIGLPAVLHFLLHQFVTPQIHPLLTIQSYISFVLVYMVGSSLLFQVPLILLFINRIKPLKPKRLLHFERWIILGSFVVAGLMNPSIQIYSQLIVAGPIIIMYQIGILIIWLLNRASTRRQKTSELIEKDNEIRTTQKAQQKIAAPSLAASNQNQAEFLAKPIKKTGKHFEFVSNPNRPYRPLRRQIYSDTVSERRMYLNNRPAYGYNSGLSLLTDSKREPTI